MKVVIKKNLKKIITTIMIVLITVLAIFMMPQNAAEINRCKINVINDGSNQKKANNEVSVIQKIIKSTDKELTFQVDFENYQYQVTQISIVLDNSFSMWSEDKLASSKSSIIDLVNNLFDNIDNVQLALTTYDGIKVTMGTDREEIINQINNITQYEGITTQTGLIQAQETFTNDEVNKYIIIFTDGQENISSVINDIKSKNINLLTAFYGAKSSISNQYTKAGTVYTINPITETNLASVNTKVISKIKANMVKEINDININNIFSDEITSNFMFEIVKNPSAGTISTTDGGYNWQIDNLTKKSKASFQYKLTLKNDLDRNIMYKDITTNKNMSILYKNNENEDEIELKNLNTPVIKITETYTLKIKAINKKYTGLDAKGIKFRIEQIDETENVIRTEEKETNSNGEIILDDLTENGTYKFRITQISTPAAYELSDESKRVKTVTISKDYLSNTIEATTEDSDDCFEIDTNYDEKIVTATIKMDPREFLLNIRKIDEEYKNYINEVDFALAEPKGENIPNGITVNGRTKTNGTVLLAGEVAGAGTYTYTLNETNIPTGYYENTNEMKLNITFEEDGTPSKVTSSSKNIIIDSETAISGDTVNIDVTNKMLDYTLKIQAFNKKYTGIKIDNVKVQITGKDSEENIVYTNEQITKNGVIEVPINKYGEITYTIKQISAPAEYSLTNDVIYNITRTFEDNNLKLNSPIDDENIILDNGNKLLTVNLYLDQKTFNFKVNKVDKEDTSILLDNAKINLIQPSSRDKLENTTTEGCINFEADVVCQKNNEDGTYTSTYNLKEIEKPIGYKKINDNIGVNITFNSEGKVINAESLNTEYLEIIKNNTEVEVNLKNELQTYSLQLVAKNKKYKNINIPDVEMKVKGKTESVEFLGTTVLTTSATGETDTISKLKQEGILKFDIEETSVPTGYIKNNQVAYVKYDFATEKLSVPTNEDENIKVIVDNDTKTITIEVYIEPKLFNIEISKKCSSILGDTLIEGAKFVLEQPDINSTKREKINGITELDNKLILSGEVAGKDGPYQYILKETSAPEGYENNGIQLKLNITFDTEGKIATINNEEIHNAKGVNTIDESNDYIAEEVDKDYVTCGTVKNDGEKDIIPILVENEQEKPKLEINVYNKYYKYVTVPGTEVSVIGQDSNGEFYNKTLKTDYEGKIKIAGISNTGDFDFKALATKVPTGYIAQTTETIAYINKDVTTTTLKERIDSQNVVVSGNKITINLYLEPKTFSFEISKYEEELDDLLIPNIQFTVTQPNIAEKISRKTISGKTVKGEKLILYGEVAGEGTYQYTITETVPNGYIDNNIEFIVNVTFDSNGDITSVTKSDDETTTNCSKYVTLGSEYISNNIPITIVNSQKDYSITVELTNSKYRNEEERKGIKIENAKIKVTGTTPDGKQIYESQELKTDSDGKIKFEPLTQRGDVTYKIEVLDIPTGYILPENKIININKDEVTTEITLTESVDNVTIDNENKDIHVNLFAEVQTFTIELSKKDKDEEDVLLEGANFSLKQPSFEDIGRKNFLRNNVSGSTKLNERLILTAEVAGENGPYKYKIVETSPPDGYTANSNETELEIEFNKDGTIKNVNCLSDEKNAYIDTSRTTNQTVSVNIINTKKPYSIKVQAINAEHKLINVEGLKLKIIGKDSKNNIVYESEELLTNASGIATWSGLTTTGDVTYEIKQLAEAPTAYVLGNSKYVNLNINRLNNKITCLNESDGDISVNDASKVIDVKIYIEPKRFTINLSKLDYDDKLKNIDTFIAEANFTITNPNGVKKTFKTTNDKTLEIEAEVGGEGTYTYELWEDIPSGYQEFYAKIFLEITFDKYGNIISEKDITTEEKTEPVNVKLEWWSWYKDNKGEIHWEKVQHEKYQSELTGYTQKSVDLYVTNIKKEYSLKINTIDDKYNDYVSNVYMEVIATNEKGEEIYDEIVKTENGTVTIPEFRECGKVNIKIKEVSVPTQYNSFNEKEVTIDKLFPSREANVDEDNTSKDIEVKVTYADLSEAKKPVNSPTTINITIKLNRKTFDIKLNKVDIDNNKILLSGAKFTLVQYDKKHQQTEITDEDGVLTLSADIDGILDDLPEEEIEYLYVLTEDESPKGYNNVTTSVNIYVTLNKKDEITNVRITNGSSIISEIEENRTNKSIELIAQNAKEGSLYNLEFTKKYENIAVNGSMYKIKIQAESGEDLSVKDITDKNGEIQISKIPGNKKIIIAFQEIKPASGYELDQSKKIVTVQRNILTGDIEIIESETSEDVKASYEKTKNTILVEINTPKPKEKKNVIRVVSVDKNDEAKSVAYAKVQIILPEDEGILDVQTDSNGYINLNDIKALSKGTYRYLIRVTQTPTGYFDFQGGDINVDITFNEYGNIIQTELAMPNDYAEGYYTTEEDDTNFFNIANVVEKNTPKEIIELNLTKFGEEEIKLKNVEFNIRTITTIDGKETISNLNKKTDSNGLIKCEVLSGDKVEIGLKEIETQEIYKLDGKLKEIVLEKVDEVLQIVESDSGIEKEFIDNKLNVTITNEYKPAKVIMQLINKDSEDNAIKLRGIKLKLKEVSSGKEYDVTTDEAGELEFNDLPVENAGTYKFIITEMTTVQGHKIPNINETNPITILLEYTRTEEGNLEVKDPISYSSTNDLVKGISYTNYSAPEEYRLFLRVVLSDEVTKDAKFNVNIYKLDKKEKEENGVDKYLSDANFNVTVDYLNDTTISINKDTDKNGKITYTTPLICGNMKINFKELTAPDGYQIDDAETKEISLYKDMNGNINIISEITSESMYTKCDNSEINIYVMDTKEESGTDKPVEPDIPDKPVEPDIPDNPDDKEYNYQIEVDKIDKETQKPMENVEFTILSTDRKIEGSKFTTNDEGKILINVNNIKANEENTFKIEETKPDGYKQIDTIELKVLIGDDGKVGDVKLLKDNEALKETIVKDGVVKLIVENEKEATQPDKPVKPTDPDVPDNPENPTDPDNPENPDVPVDPEEPDKPVEPTDPENPNNPDAPENPGATVNPNTPDAPVNPEYPEETKDNNGTNSKADEKNNNKITGTITTALKNLPYTGKQSIILILIVTFASVGTISYIKYKK